ncbi:nitroreductase [Pseudomonas sp. C27(2019)]|uniref:nitroreductase family protein n=1 Tax=Pseudomonas sp. C27(2019) TaxID=2604941 RepID=UPI001243F0DE|nr:nitroreductase [Pseudomonas sp. C27(2019)]QEY58692.1 nitroreductase [Pseudomonas sp. C27(2019)]
MDAIELLLKRVSVPRLQEPAPTAEQLEIMLRAALRAPDHGQLRPWRFLTIAGDNRKQLGELFVQAVLSTEPNASFEQIEKTRNLPMRAPMLLVVIASVSKDPKVPAHEQLLAAGCAAHGVLLAAHALGVGAVWRTGAMAELDMVNTGLGLQDNEQIIAYIYLGTPINSLRNPPLLDPADFVRSWPEKTPS